MTELTKLRNALETIINEYTEQEFYPQGYTLVEHGHASSDNVCREESLQTFLSRCPKSDKNFELMKAIADCIESVDFLISKRIQANDLIQTSTTTQNIVSLLTRLDSLATRFPQSKNALHNLTAAPSHDELNTNETCLSHLIVDNLITPFNLKKHAIEPFVKNLITEHFKQTSTGVKVRFFCPASFNAQENRAASKIKPQEASNTISTCAINSLD